MQEIIVDEGKIKCLITGKMRKETPEEYVRQEYCRILLDVYKYPKSHIDVEYPIKVKSPVQTHAGGQGNFFILRFPRWNLTPAVRCLPPPPGGSPRPPR